VLHPIRRSVPGLLGDRPAVLAPQPPTATPARTPGPPPRLHPRKPARDPPHQLIELFPPPGGVYAEHSGHRRIVMSGHKP
jgi:hypothetical protein